MQPLENYNKGLIYTDLKGCIDCNKCIHECPVLRSNVSVVNDDGNFKLCVDENECILCGTCLDTCVHNARQYKDDFDEFLSDLQQGKSFSMLIAPSFYFNYPNEYKNILGYLRSLGVKNFYSVSFGADIATWGYINYMSKNNPDGNISQPCPTVILYIEKHLPELLPNIIPVQSPMMCTAIYLKRYLGIEEDLVFLSPCIAKKIEIESKRGLGLVGHNITYKNLMEHIKNQEVNLKDCVPIEEELESKLGLFYPSPGGLKENIEYYMGRGYYQGRGVEIIKVEGERKSHDHLEVFAKRLQNRAEYVPMLIDILNCDGGCSYGTGTQFRHTNDNEADYQALIARKKKYDAIYQEPFMKPGDRVDALNEIFKELKLEDFMCEYDSTAAVVAREISEDEIETVFKERLKKLDDIAKTIDCSACGYPGCRYMAKAIAYGINHANNCIFHVRDALAESIDETIAAEVRMRAVVDNMPLVTNITDKDLNMLDCNEEAPKLFGFRDKQEYMNRFIETWAPIQPDGTVSMDKARTIHLKALETGHDRFEWLHQKSNGEPIPCEITLVRIVRSGEVYLLAFIRDLREFYKNQENSRLLEQRLKAMLDSSPMLCAIFGEQFNVLEVNQTAVDLLGLPDKQYYIDNFLETLPEYQPDGTPSLQRMKELLDLVLETGSGHTEFTQRSFDGELVPCDVYLRHVTLGNKNVVVVYAYDLRPSIKARKAKELAEKESHAKTRFLANVSHEIRTPMNSILGIVSMELQKENHPPETVEAFQRIYNSSGLLLNIINEILDLSRAEEGKIEINSAPYETVSLIVDTLQLNMMHISGKNVEFNLKVNENLPSCLIGDELRIKQILNNLITNAFKYTVQGEVILSFSIEDDAVDCPTNHVMLNMAVSDTGQGMTEEQLGKIFDAFTRLEHNRAIEGTGLGLNITKVLVTMMNGQISVDSEQGSGSTFTVRIPQQLCSDDVVGMEAASSLQNFEFNDKFMKKTEKFAYEPMPYGKVLVVDDLEANLYVARGLLQPYQITVDSAVSGSAAIEIINSGEEYDVIFMDHMMPQLDGVETVRILRGNGYDGTIVALTANALVGSEEAFILSGFDWFISKPIDIRELDLALSKFVKAKHPEEAAKYKNAAHFEGVKTIEASSEMLRIVKGDAKQAAATLRETIASGDMKLFVTTAHAMKAALSYIEQDELSKEAAELEKAGLTGDLEYINSYAIRFIERLEALSHDIDEFNSQNSEDSEIIEDTAYLAEQLRIVKIACEEYDITGAVTVFDRLLRRPWHKETQDTLHKIRDTLFLDSDFDKALEILNDFMQ